MIVFLHGWGMDKSIFKPFVDEYLADQEVLLLDLPGYGDEVFHNRFIEQVELLKNKIPRGAHVVAWSLAGIYVLRLDALFPGYLSKITMVCSTPSFSQKNDFPNALTKNLLEQFSGDLISDRQKTIDRFLMLQLHGQPKIKEQFLQIKKLLAEVPEVNSSVLEFGLDLLKNEDCRDDFSSSKLHIQFILGSRDKLVPVDVVKELKILKKDVQIVILEKVAHLPFITHQKIFYEEVFAEKL